MKIGMGKAFSMQYALCEYLDFSPRALFIDITYKIRSSITSWIVSERVK